MSSNTIKMTVATIMAAMVLSAPAIANDNTKETVKEKIQKMPYRVWATN